MDKTIAVCSQKGGTGKTMVCTLLAGALQTTKQQRVTIIDADPQRSSAEWFESIKDPKLAELGLIEHCRPDLHQRALTQPGEIGLIDCPGAIAAILESALKAADVLLVPMRASHSDARSIPKLEAAIKALKRSGRPLRIGVVLNQVRIGPKLERRTAELRAGLPPNFHLFESRLRRLDDFEDAFGSGCTPLEYQPKGAAAADLTRFSDEFFAWVTT
jgi:chromosome partitioning protein